MNNTQQILISQKKTCTKERLLKVLSAIAELRITYEGEGGRCAYYGDDYEVGTGLRAPDMPLYYKPKKSRRAVLNHLEERDLITIKNHDEDEWKGFEVSVQGLIILELYNVCEECGKKKEWYKVTSFTQTGERSGIKHISRNLLCECKANKYLGCKEVGIEKINTEAGPRK